MRFLPHTTGIANYVIIQWMGRETVCQHLILTPSNRSYIKRKCIMNKIIKKKKKRQLKINQSIKKHPRPKWTN